MSILEQLIIGRERIEQGWVQNTHWEEEQGEIGFCTVGALTGAISFTTSVWKPYERTLNLLGSLLRNEYITPRTLPRELARNREYIYYWNDAEGRTKQDVLDLYDRAIEMARQLEELEAAHFPVKEIVQEPAIEIVRELETV